MKETRKQIVYTNCCKNGKIQLPKFIEPPTYLKILLNPKGDKLSKHFLQKIRQYNIIFSFTSVGGNIDYKINQGGIPYFFRGNGQIHHHIRSLLPSPDTNPKFAKLYIFDTKIEIENRIKAWTNEDPNENDLNREIIKGLQKMLDECNPLVKWFCHAHNLFEENKGIDLSIKIIGANKGDAIQYEMPHPEELPILIVGDLSLENYKWDIIFSTRSNDLWRISIFHPAYICLYNIPSYSLMVKEDFN
jgi:hypothetical protein